VGGRDQRPWEQAVLGAAVVAGGVALGLGASHLLQVMDNPPLLGLLTG
jgi:hypothetical protein